MKLTKRQLKQVIREVLELQEGLERARIGGNWGKTFRDPRGVRVTAGGSALTTAELSGGAKPAESKRPKVKFGDVVTVVERNEEWSKIQTDDGRTGWVQNMFLEPVTEH